MSDSGAALADRTPTRFLSGAIACLTVCDNRAGLTAKAIVNGWYYTGGLGFCGEGELYVVGRNNDLIIVGDDTIAKMFATVARVGKPQK